MGSTIESHYPSILETIRARTIEHPDATAICTSAGGLTYAELDRTSNQLAHHLRGLGVGPDVFVPMLFEHCQWVVITQLAILKVGGAYVPLEPSNPDTRLADIITSTNCGFLLSSEANADRATLLSEKTFCIGSHLVSELRSKNGDGAEFLSAANPNTPAYVLFTSGSTGRPKGCVVEHRALAMIPEQARLELMGLSANSRVLQFASYTFAISIVEIYYPLCMGATICIPSDYDRTNNLSAVMEEMKVSWACITPSLLRSLDPQRPPSGLRTMLIGGEAIKHGEFDSWTRTVDLVYAYGASEHSGAIGLAAHRSKGAAFTPVPSLRFWIVDAADHHKLVHAGEVGELVLEGRSLAQRYINHPSKTPSPFIQTPSWRLGMDQPHDPAAYMYRTGDLFRRDADGSVSYVARKDTQVKIRGKRVDLGEVEFHVKQSCRAISRVIAEATPLADTDGAPVLVAFLYSMDYLEEQTKRSNALFLPSSEAFQSNVKSLQAALPLALPDYMLPSIYIPLGILPMTITGKVDRRKLRENLHKLNRSDLDTYQSSSPVERVPPSTVLERRLHSMFAQVLDVDDISFGVLHDFVRLGGDSVAAMRVVSLSQSEELPPLTVADILAHQTIRKLAQHLEETATAGSQPVANVPPFSLLLGLDVPHISTLRSFAAEQCHIPVDAVEDIYPCTPLQEGLMVSTIKVAGRYVARCVFDVAKGVDLHRLQAAWQATADSNVMLRTRIVQSQHSGLVQIVLRRAHSAIQWASYPSLEAYQQSDSALSMGPGDPLARFSIIGTSVSGVTVALTLHHAIFDMLSLNHLLEQTEKAYNGQSLPANTFSPFIQSLRQLDSPVAREFWQNTLANLRAPAFPPLGHDMVVPKATADLQRIVTLPRERGSAITLSNMARLAWAIVVSNHTDSDDVVFGVTVNGRDSPVPGIEQMTGPTIATVPVRVRCHPSDTVADALMAVQSLAIRMSAFAQVGLQNIRRISADAAAACEFQSQLIFQPAMEQLSTDQPAPIMTGKSGKLGGVEDYSVFINYAFGLLCTPSARNESLHIRAQFDPHIVPNKLAGHLLTQFGNVLQQLCSDQKQQIRQLELVSVEELDSLMKSNGSNPFPVEYPYTLTELVLSHAQRAPSAPAVSSWDQQLTYQRLDTLSAEIGQQVIRAGVRKGDRVALCFEKSVWPVVSILGVLRAGGVVVSIEPALPEARKNAIIQLAQPSLLLTSTELRPVVESLHTGLPLVEISSTTVLQNPARDTTMIATSWPSVGPQDVAFVLFTSGSTGTPKGIVIEHRQFSTAMHHHREALGAHPGMRTLHFCSYAWDMSLEEIFLTWVHGGCLCVPSETQRMSNLTGFMRDHGVNWATMTPSASTILTPEDVPGLQTLVLAGEAIPIELMEMWSSRVRLVNAYGPAEAFTCAAGQIKPGMHQPGSFGPMCATAGWVTAPDDVNKLAPLGAVGELLLEGPLVTQGYLNQPEKTREAFIQAPRWLEKIRRGATGRLFRSGDLVRYEGNGHFQYMGRKDSQVKLRGQRIVLGDIERELQYHFPSARQVVAEIIRPNHGAALLVAFIHQGPTADKKDMLLQQPDNIFRQSSESAVERLRELLPAHMIPMTMFPISNVPQSTTGKVDRRMLCQAAQQLAVNELQSYRIGSDHSEVAKSPPRTAAETMWRGLWARVLSIPDDSIGRDDHFLRMGGDSIQVMKLIALARQQGLRRITFQDVFQHPRLKEIALFSSAQSSHPGPPHDKGVPAPFSLIADAETLIQKASVDCGICTEDIEDIYPCTPLQAALMASTAHDGDAYIALKSYILKDGIQSNRLVLAWNTVAEARQILRTRIIQSISGDSYQVVVREGLSWTRATRKEDAHRFQPPCVGLGTPLINLCITDHELLVSVHHSLYDGWMLPLLEEEVGRAYRGQALEERRPFSSFSAYVSENVDSAGSYWRKQLADAEPVHFPALPSLDYKPNAKSSMVKLINLPMSIDDQSSVTMATKIQLAWAIVLSTYTNTRDIVYGLISAGRTAPIIGIEKILGPTLATAPLRVQLDPAQEVRHALDLVQDLAVAQAAYEHIGLKSIAQQGDNAAAACRFQTLLLVESMDQQEEVSGAWFQRQGFSSDITKFSSHAITLMCHLLPGSVEATAIFDDCVVAEPQMKRILSQFESILSQIQSAGPSHTTLEELHTLSAQDWDEISMWNEKLPRSVDRCVHDLVHEQCEKQPQAMAVQAWDGDLTYKELDGYVQQLASKLKAHGVGPGKFVALYLEKSLWTVVAQLAVNTAGGVFTTLETSQPASRLRQICETVQPTIILVSDALHGRVSELEMPAKVVLVGKGFLQDIRIDSDGSRPLTASPSDPMFTVATSGTTGRPKVAVIEHRAFLASAKSMLKRWGITRESRVFQFAGYGFDAMIGDHFYTLLAGGCICLPSAADRDNRLVQTMNEMRANFVTLTASMIRSLSPADFPHLRTLVQGGEPMQQSIIDTWSPHVRLINGYGPAECCICSSCTAPTRPDSTNPDNIGFATGGVTWIVNPDHPDSPLVPIGAEGELIIEGPTLAREYVKDPVKTAAAFAPRPPWLNLLRGSEGENRVYRTGDIVRYNPDGSMSFVRRKDSQIKLRGQRIELKEVEHHVQQCFPDSPQVVAAVMAVKDSASLVALVLLSSSSVAASTDAPNDGGNGKAEWVLSAAGQSQFLKDAQAAELSLQEQVPGYMVPNLFIPVSRIPRDANGKADRREINRRLASMTPDEVQSYSASASDLVPPQNDLQHDIRGIWAAVLNVAPEDIGIHNSFFRIGGDSISSMQVAAQCSAAGIPLTVKDLFKHRTIEQVAAHTKRSASTQGLTTSWSERDDLIDTPVTLSPIQKMFFDHAPQNPNHFTQTFLLRVDKSDLDDELVMHALDVLVETHSMLRARFEKATDGKWMQRIPTDIEGKAYRYQNHGRHSMDAIHSICRNCQKSLNIQHGPLLAINKFRREEDDTPWICLVAHHLVVDLVSWRVILADLEQLLADGPVPRVPSTSFLRWCKLQDDYASRHLSVIEQEVKQDIAAYWGDGVMNHNTHSDVNSYKFILDQDTSQILLTSANNTFGTQPVEIVQSAVLHSFVQLFQDRPAPVVFSEGHGREPWDAAIDLTRTVGWFTTIWPTPVALEPSDGFLTALRRTKDARRRTPANGWEYFTSQCLHPQGPKTFETVELILNYQGRYQQLERADALLKIDAANHLVDGDMAEDMPRFALLDVAARVVDDCLHLEFTVNSRMKHQDRLRQWPLECERSLREAAGQLSPMCQRIMTVSDFPMASASLTSDRFNEILTQIQYIYEGAPVAIEDVYSCSMIQQGILMSHSRNPTHYQQLFEWRLVSPSPVNADRLVQSWNQVVERHSILRTVFADSSQGNIEQLVLKGVPAMIRFYNDPCDAVEPASIGPFRPLHYLNIHRNAGSGETVMRLSINHALIDGTSMPIIKRDLLRAFNGQLASAGPPLSSYRDYVSYLRSNGAGQESQSYWRARMQGAPPCLFPSLKALDGQDPQHESKTLVLELGKPTGFTEFCETHGLALTVLFHVAWAIVIHRYTAMEDISFGYVTSGRNTSIPGIEDMVGPMVNMLVSRVQLPCHQSILSICQEYHEAFLGSLDYQHQSLADTLHSIGSTSDLFNTLISVQDRRGMKPDHNPSCFDLVDENLHDGSEYPVTLNVGISDEKVILLFSHHTSHMDDDSASLVAKSVRQVVSEVLRDPSLAINDLEVLDQDHRRRILGRNSSIVEPVDSCVHHAIHQRCLSHPDSPAVCAWDGDLTYEQLAQVSSTLAEELIDHGIGPEMTVPILLEKSRWVPAAVLGVLKAGASFVLMDSSHPRGRLQNIYETSEAQLVLASEETFPKAMELSSTVINVGHRLSLQATGKSRSRWPNVNVDARNAAYMVFTSGSTGTPKGAVVDHSCLATAAKHIQSRLYINSTSRVLQFSSHAWDIPVTDIIVTLLAGGCVCIPSEEERTGDIASAANRMRVNWSLLTPTVSRLVNPDDFVFLETLVLAGEPISPTDLATWHDRVRLINGYGPAECSLISTVSAPLTASSNPRAIGNPNGCVTWVVDRDDYHRLVPDGAVGELLLEGPIVGRGYRNNAEKSAAAYVRPPPSWLVALRNGPSSIRLYRTGDLVRYTSDGSLVFVGRKDNQVKIRGQRVELGEIENQVARAFQGSHVTVELLRLAEDEDALLVAFVLPQADHEACASRDSSSDSHRGLLQPPSEVFHALTKAAVTTLGEAIPSYMIPTAFLPLARVPRAPTGKTDRKVLRELVVSMSSHELDAYSRLNATRRIPETAMEARLQEHVGRVLKRTPDTIPLDEDVFQVGLDSVKAMTLVASAAREGLRITVPNIFKHPQLSQLALVLEEAHTKLSQRRPAPQTKNPLLESADALCAKWDINRSQVSNVLPATYFQRASIESQHLAHMAIHFTQPVDLARLKTAVLAAIGHHDILRTVFVPFNNTIVQLVLRDMEVPTHHIETDGEPSLLVESICDKESQLPVLSGRPATRLTVISNPCNHHVSIVLRLSHAQYDGLSMRLTHNAIKALYDGGGALPKIASSYGDFLCQRQQRASPEAYGFWRDLLHGSVMTRLVPEESMLSNRDRFRKDLLVTSSVTMPKPEVRGGITMATYVKAAWALTLVRQTQTHDVVFGQLVSGRTLPLADIDRVVGPCVNYIPVRVALQPTWAATDLLHALQRQHVSTMAHDMVDWDHLVAESTAWPRNTEFGSGVHYLEVGQFWDDDTVPFSGGITCRNQHLDSKMLQTYPMMTCIANQDGPPMLKMTLTSAVFGQGVADRILAVFHDMMVYLTSHPEMAVGDALRY